MEVNVVLHKGGHEFVVVVVTLFPTEFKVEFGFGSSMDDILSV